MKKVAFYVNNSQFPNVDCSNITKGNPGIGGTWHMVLLIASQLASRENDMEVTLYAQENSMLPSGPDIRIVTNQKQAIYNADIDAFDYIVLNYGGFCWKEFDFRNLKSKLKIIVWCHNFCSLSDLTFFAGEPRIAKIVTVSREQMDLYRDHPAFSKSDYIYNCVPFPDDYREKALQNPFEARKHNVVYLASLVPAKSFHVLAEVWPTILKKVPDANLFVVGSGKTYFKDASLGDYGVASRDYENKFIPPLTDKKGNILPSVHFLGNLGQEKYEYLYSAKVGVPNPTGSTETFCISAVEMQYLGCVVTAMMAPGYYDTFLNGVITKRSKKSFVNSIVRLLKSSKPIIPYSESVDKLQAKFSVESIVKEWETLFSHTLDTHLHPLVPVNNKSYRLKWLKELKRLCHLNSKIPVVENLLEKLDVVKIAIKGF